jgi:L-2,4-diaminobutyrate transaminase
MPKPPTRQSLEQLDVERVFHPATSIAELDEKGPVIIAEGRDCRIKTNDGRELIDAAGGLWCVNVGYGREELGRAAAQAMGTLGYYHSFGRASNEPQIRLADRIVGLLESQAGIRHMSRVFFGCTGSDANDSLVKLVRYYNNLRGKPAKKKIISRLHAYHGVTLASASLTGIPAFHQWFDLPIDTILHVSPPYAYRYANPGESDDAFCDRLVNDLEALILREGPDTVAAFIAEPVMGAGGVIVPPERYFDRVQAVLRDHDVLFLADEVICGFGRLGHWFGAGRYRLQPDMMSLAKGLTSGYFPLSAVVISEKVWQVLADASKRTGVFAHGFTYSGHPVGAAVALANLDIIERESLVANAQRVGAHLRSCVEDALKDHPNVGEIRGEGMILGIEFVRDRSSKQPFDAALAVQRRVAEQAFAQGLVVRPLSVNGVIAISPPLSLTRSDAERIADLLKRAVSVAFDTAPVVNS